MNRLNEPKKPITVIEQYGAGFMTFMPSSTTVTAIQNIKVAFLTDGNLRGDMGHSSFH